MPAKPNVSPEKKQLVMCVNIGFGPEYAFLHFCATTAGVTGHTVSIHLALCMEYECEHTGFF